MTYTLETNGDNFEKHFYPRLTPLFPDYENFWRKIVVPSTMRDIDGTIQLREGVDRDLELLFMYHYSCYIHLGIALEILDLSPKFPYLIDDFLFHMHAGMEMVSRKKWNRGKAKEGKGFIKYCSNVRAKIIKPGKSESYYDVLANSLGKEWQAKKTEFDDLLIEVSNYRNAITHDPRLGQLYEPKSERRWIPKHNLVGNLAWSDIKNLSFSEDIVNFDELVDRLEAEVPDKINALWPEIIDEFTMLSSIDEYQKLACTSPYSPQKSILLNQLLEQEDTSRITTISGLHPSQSIKNNSKASGSISAEIPEISDDDQQGNRIV